MSRDVSYTSLILKKQPFGEGDEIVTCFTKEAGKQRFFAKSTKLSKSRLQYSLQALFLVEITVTGASNFPKIIHAQTLETYAHLRQHLPAIKIAYYAVELLLKFTADEQKNEELFNFYLDFFNFLNSPQADTALETGLAVFKIRLLNILGYGVHYSEHFIGDIRLGFSNARGGFGIAQGADFIAIRPETFTQFLALQKSTFSNIPQFSNIIELQDLLSGFIRYHLERDVKSEGFLTT